MNTCLLSVAQSWFQQKWWRWGLGIGLLIVLILSVGPTAMIDTLRRISVGWAFTLAALAFLWLFLGGLNVWLLLQRLTPIRLSVFLSVYVISWATSRLLPGQLGDVSQVFWLRQHGISMASSGAAYLVDKTISLGWLVLVAAYGASRYLPCVYGRWSLILLVLGAGAGIAAIIATRHMSLLSTFTIRLSGVIDQIRTFKQYPRIVTLNVTGTIVKWLLVAFLYWGAFRAFGASLPFEATATIPVMSSLVGYIPVTVGGAGTVEWTSVALFSQVGASSVTVLSVHLLLRASLLLVAFFTLLVSRLGHYGMTKVRAEGTHEDLHP